jgi:hypothetical protein
MWIKMMEEEKCLYGNHRRGNDEKQRRIFSAVAVCATFVNIRNEKFL